MRWNWLLGHFIWHEFLCLKAKQNADVSEAANQGQRGLGDVTSKESISGPFDAENTLESRVISTNSN